MADIGQLEQALRNADKAGDAQAARILAAEILKQRGGAAPLSPDKPAEKPAAPFVPSGEKGLPSSIWDTSPEMLAGNPLTRFATGAAAPVLGLMQLGAHVQQPVYEKLGIPLKPADFMDTLIRRNAELRNAGREAQGDSGMDVPYTAGMVMSPTTLAAGKIPAAATLPGRMVQGAAIGAAAGGATPVEGGDYESTKTAQTGGGAAAGAILPAVTAGISKVGRGVYHGLIEPWARPAAIKGRAYLEAAGDKADEIVNLLTRNRQIVLGSAPTAGEVAAPAGRTEFSALQRSAEKAAPSSYFARAEEQNAARIAALDTFAGNPAKRAAASAVREAKAGPLYEKGYASTTFAKIPQDLLERPSMQAALKRAERLAEEKNQTFGALAKPGVLSGSAGEDAYRLKQAFDDLIKLSPRGGMDTAELQAIKDTRSEYIKWMEAQFPRLATARAVYKGASAPINQMDVGEELTRRLTPALREEGKQRAGVFANALRESTGVVKKATGEPRFGSIEDVLTGRQLQTVHNVQEDLARSDLYQHLARAGANAGPNALDLATGNLEREAGGKLPNLLHRGAMIANAIITRLEGKVNRKLAAEMAVEMLNPPTVAGSLQTARQETLRNKMLAAAIERQLQTTTAGGTLAVGQAQGE